MVFCELACQHGVTWGPGRVKRNASCEIVGSDAVVCEYQLKNIHLVTMNARVCSVCSKSNASYRCPKCRAGYCSKDCCKFHQDRDCAHYKTNSVDTKEQPLNPVASQATPSEEKPALCEVVIAANSESPSNQVKELREECTAATVVIDEIHAVKPPTLDDRIIRLTEEQKRRLSQSNILKTLMGSKRFRDDLEKIDTDSHRSEMLKKMRLNNSEFNVSVEKIMKIVQGSERDS